MGRRRRHRHRLQVACGAALACKSTARRVPEVLAIHEQINQARQGIELPMHLANLELPAATEATAETETEATEAVTATEEATDAATEAATKAATATDTAIAAATPTSASTSTPSPCPDDFVEAIKKGDVELVKEILSEKEAGDLETCTVSFKAWAWPEHLVPVTGVALHLAAYLGNADIVQALLDHQADENAPTTEGVSDFKAGSTPLMLASAVDEFEVVKKLLAAQGILVNQENQAGKSALMTAVGFDSFEVVKALLDSKDIDVNLRDKDGRSALMTAASRGYVKVVTALLKREDIDVNLRDKDGYSALIVAAIQGKVEVVEALLERPGIKVNLQTEEDRYSALIVAARSGHGEVVHALLKREDIDVNRQDKDGQSALIWAAGKGEVEVVKALLKRTDIDVNLQDKENQTALISVVRKADPHYKVIWLLLTDTRVDVNKQDKDGVVALVYLADISKEWVENFVSSQETLRAGFLSAAHTGHKKALEAFISVWNKRPHLDFDLGNCSQENRALVAAAQGGQVELAQWLLQQNQAEAELHCRDEENHTALERSVRYGHYFVTKTLLQHAASVTADIDDPDDEAKAYATWMGVEYTMPELIRPFAASKSGPWAMRIFRKPPDNCEGDMKGRCSGVLLGHAQSTEMLHRLWSWQTFLDNHNEVWSANRREALVANLQRLGGEAAALALLSRGVSLTKEQVDEASGTWQWPPGPNKMTNMTLHHVQTWNRLHWCALSCDGVALTSAYSEGRNNQILKLLNKEEGQDWTPKEVAAANREDCPGVYEVLQTLEDLRDALRLQGNFYIFSATTAAVVCIGIYTNRLLFLQQQSFQKHGWYFMLVVPTTLTSIGCGIAFLYHHYQGSLETVPKAMTILGIVVAAAGVLLTLATSIVFKCEGAADYIRELKKKGNRKLDRCWEKLECGISWCLFAVVFIQGLVVKGKRLGLFAGFVNAVASTLPLVMASPRPWAISLRLLPGTCVVAWWVHTLQTSESADELELLSAETLLISTMCLAVAWGDARGACAAAVGTVARIVEIEMVHKEGADKFTAGKLIFGRAEIAAHGIEHALGLTSEDISAGLKDPIEAMRQEIDIAGDKNDRENFKYIVEGTSGNPDDYPTAVAESLRTGKYHGGEIGPNDFDTGHQGRTLSDWMEEKEVRLARMSQAEFIAVRFYTSSSFPKINGPLRKKAQAIADDDHEEKAKRHPWAMVVFLMDRGIKKLRSVQAQVDPDAFARQTTLWRGMKNMEADIVKFKRHGGTEMAPMSTTTNEDVARHYAASKVPLVFKYVVGGMKTGVCIRFLSLYPKEEEFLYAPLTYLTLKNQYEDDGTTVLVVEPVMS